MIIPLPCGPEVRRGAEAKATVFWKGGGEVSGALSTMREKMGKN